MPIYSYANEGTNEELISVRVAVAKDVDSVKLAIVGNYKMVNLVTKEVLLEERYLPSSNLTPTKEGFKIGDMSVVADAIAIEPIGGARVYIDGRIFRGEIKVLKREQGLLVINTVNLEEYLYGVIRNEVSTWWPIEAIKAQVIAARTYALYQIKDSKGKDYDVTADVSSQVYGGIFSEKWRTNKAVDKTKGKVLAYNGAIFPAYYHATCGGSTFDASYLWKIDLPPLKGVKCGWCKRSPHYSWEKWVPRQEVRAKLEKAGYVVGDIAGFEPTKKDRSGSGRILEIRIKGNITNVDILAKDFRRIIGTDVLRSANFKVTIIGPYVAFEGLGWGHGVGMCQWGAYYMARRGKKMEEILNFYYPASKIVDYKDVK
ncbi:MAG: SpoIID/LytB domain-containing protein [Candidatus Omnitrophota bacterium]